MSGVMNTSTIPASMMSPIRSAPKPQVPTEGSIYRTRKVLKQSIETYCHSMGKDCYQGSSGGTTVTFHCVGKKQTECTFKVTAKRVERNDTNNVTWKITSVCLDHEGCAYTLPSPKLSTLIEDTELMTYAASAKSDKQMIEQASMLRNINMTQTSANRLRNIAAAYTLGYTNDPNIGFSGLSEYLKQFEALNPGVNTIFKRNNITKEFIHCGIFFGTYIQGLLEHSFGNLMSTDAGIAVINMIIINCKCIISSNKLLLLL